MRNGGFTLVELMIAVAILGILTGILVLAFDKPANKVRTGSEVNAVFAEFHRAQAQYALENGVYYSTGDSDAALFPSTPGRTQQDITDTKPAEWTTLKVATNPKLYCGYVTIAGTAEDEVPAFALDFGMGVPDGNWYLLYARCDADGNSSVDAKYFSSSLNTELISRNEGR